jgi:SAM-dependent methyltransferase
MTLDDRVALIRPGVDRRDGTWADLGAGAGAFTFALAFLLGPGALIHAIDRDAGALRSLEREYAKVFSRPASASGPAHRLADGRAPRIVCTAADFTREVPVPPLDGALVANALHFHADSCGILARVAGALKPGAVLIIVEYDVQRSTPWVPHPLPWSRLPETAACAGLGAPRLLGTRPSRYHGSMYAAACIRAASGAAAGENAH